MILACLPSGPAAAQDSTARRQLGLWQDQLTGATDVGTVAELEAKWRLAAEGNLRRLGIAFADLRRFELGDLPALAPAWDQFRTVVAEEPHWPWARLGLGRAALARDRAGPGALAGHTVGGHFSGFVLQMDLILQQEPTFAPARELALSVGAASDDREQRQKLARVFGKASPDPALLLEQARVALNAQRHDSALRYLEQYASWGGDPAQAQLQAARTLAGQGRLDEAASAWRRGIATPSPMRRAVYRSDLLWTAQDSEMAKFDTLPDDSLPAFADRFWSRRDAREIRADGERLQEHLRRWVYVYQHFRVPIPERRTQFSKTFRTNLGYCLNNGPNTLDDLDPPDPSRDGPYRGLDHRALVYMRHGKPLREVGGFQPGEAVDGSATAFGSLPSGTGGLYAGWLYMIEGEARVFIFEPDGALGLDAPRALVLNKTPNLDLLLRFQDVVPGYGKLASRRQILLMTIGWETGMALPFNCMPGVNDEIQNLREDAIVAMRTDTYARRIDKPLDASVQAYAMGRAGQRPVAVVAFAIQAKQLKRDSTTADSLAHVTVRFEATALDTLVGGVHRDTTIHYVLPKRAPRGFISGLLEIPIQNDAQEVRAIVLQGGETRGMHVALPITLAPPAGLGMSDVIVGRAASQAWWRARDRGVMVSPVPMTAVGQTIEFYYELYGLVPGERYATRVTLMRSGRDRAAASLVFEDEALADTQGFTRRLALTDLPPGRYSMEIAVSRAGDGEGVSRRLPLRVVR